jgi:hypothetical protein
LQAEQRRARANAKKQQSVYHHVPKVAAADFERTATSESMGPKDKRKKYIQKLAEAALKHQTKETAAHATVTFGFRKTHVLDQARVQREPIGERNPLQRTRDLEDATLLDERTSKRLPQRNLGTDHLDAHQTSLNSRPLSTGDLVWEDGFLANKSIFSGKLQVEPLKIPYASDPQDWAQRDEVCADPRRSVKERISPFLRKSDSMWMLKGKKDPKGAGLPVDAGQVALPGEVKHKKSMFLNLFKR